MAGAFLLGSAEMAILFILAATPSTFSLARDSPDPSVDRPREAWPPEDPEEEDPEVVEDAKIISLLVDRPIGEVKFLGERVKIRSMADYL